MSISILIKGMEMPTSCCACPLFKSNMSKQLFCKAFGAFDKSDYDKLPNERMKNCPLVPVPPHGRLIDADALVDKHKTMAYEDGGRSYSFHATAKAWVEAAPTIIQADQVKEET